jgi:hypothetical protein
MNKLETLLTQAQYELTMLMAEMKRRDADSSTNFAKALELVDKNVKLEAEIEKLKNGPQEFAKGYHEGYRAAERFYTQPNPYFPEGCKGSEVPKVEPWDTEDAKIRRFSYDCGFQDGFNASKVVEKQTWESPQPQVGQPAMFCTRKAPHVCTEDGPCNGFPAMFGGKSASGRTASGSYEKPAEAWITEFRSIRNEEGGWQRSRDEGLCEVFSSYEAAQAAVDEEAPRCVNIVRRVRRVD